MTEANWAILFPGQGALNSSRKNAPSPASEYARRWAIQAQQILGLNESSWCRELEADVRFSAFEQVAVLALAYGHAQWVKDTMGVQPSFVSGHSLGEITALLFAQAMTFEEAVNLVRLRGQMMDEVAASRPGAMAAIHDMTPHDIELLLNECRHDSEVVEIANYNGDQQTVISGDVSAVRRVGQRAAALTGRPRVVSLSVAGAFHSSLMGDVVPRFLEVASRVQWKKPVVPVISSVDLHVIDRAEDIAVRLARQITTPVIWTRVMARLMEESCDLIFDAGPGTVLRQMLSRHLQSIGNARCTVLSLERAAEQDRVIQSLRVLQQQCVNRSLLRAICAPNTAGDPKSVEAVRPMISKLKQLAETATERPLTAAEVESGVALGHTILAAKGI